MNGLGTLDKEVVQVIEMPPGKINVVIHYKIIQLLLGFQYWKSPVFE